MGGLLVCLLILSSQLFACCFFGTMSCACSYSLCLDAMAATAPSPLPSSEFAVLGLVLRSFWIGNKKKSIRVQKGIYYLEPVAPVGFARREPRRLDRSGPVDSSVNPLRGARATDGLELSLRPSHNLDLQGVFVPFLSALIRRGPARFCFHYPVVFFDPVRRTVPPRKPALAPSLFRNF